MNQPVHITGLQKKSSSGLRRTFSVAPMLDCTDTHYRYLARLITRHTLLYTEMVTTRALLYGDPHRLLDFNAAEHPLALQLGGSDPDELAACAKIGEQWGYDEINLNCGCPSDRVQSGRFGVCLMTSPQLVADGLKAMSDAVSIPVTIKCRIGIADLLEDDETCYDSFADFVATVTRDSGCHTVIVHARKAWLKGLSPKENREIPPLLYDYVYRLKQEMPQLEIILNGGVDTLEEVTEHLKYVDGVMMGREAYQNPYLMSNVDKLFFNDGREARSRHDICREFIEYSRLRVQGGAHLRHLARHLLGLYHEVPGAKKFRRHVSENVHHDDASIVILEDALKLIA
jgi:tRNA-dihydrouridine synthase A